MERIRRFLSQASTFAREKDMKYVDAGLGCIQVLGDRAIFGYADKEAIDEPKAHKIFDICRRSLERAKECVGAVVNLTDEEAEQSAMVMVAAREHWSSSGAPASVSPRPTTADLSDSVSGSSCRDSAALMESNSEVPLVPVSKLAQEHSQDTFRLQILFQKLERYRNANAKQRSNGRYIVSLIALSNQIRERWQQRAAVEEQIGAARLLQTRLITSLETAQQITLINFMLLKCIPPDELEQEACHRVPNVRATLDFSNYLQSWCKYEIVKPKTDMERAEMLSYFIKMAMHLHDLNNFEGIKSIIDALNATAVQRMRRTVNLVSRKLRLQLESLTLLTSERRNYAQLREVTSRAERRVIPYLQLMLDDLEQTRKGPGEAKGSSIDRPTSALLEETRSSILTAQQSSYGKDLHLDRVIQHYILTRPYRWDHEVQRMSESQEVSSQLSSDAATRDHSAAATLDEGTKCEEDNDRYDIFFQQLRSAQAASCGNRSTPSLSVTSNSTNIR